MNKYSYLNINQKMIKIRKKLPALMRKRYSEEVDYDFVKLDDINQFLTPALNKYGVDFDIRREIATQRDSLGNPVFLTQDGNLWRYEADLEICWTNADRPEEVISSTIHLVGTNDVPDKAKGTAMTYGLKYYLLNKFNIPQNGDEDPDMRGTKPVKEVVKEKAVENKKEPKKSEAAETDTGKVATGKMDRAETDKEKHKHKQEPVQTPEKENRATVVSLADKKEETKKNAFSSVEEQLSFLQPEEEDISFEEEAEMEAEEPQNEDHEIGDGFQMVKEDEEVPFSDEEETCKENEAEETDEEETDFEVAQETETEKEAPDKEAKESRDAMIEKAKTVICNFGFYKGQTLGTMLDSMKGWEGLKWIATRYNGGNVEMKEAAKLLVEAKAYMADAA